MEVRKEMSKKYTFRFEGKSYSYWKSGSGPPLIFLHNAGSTHAIWKHQRVHFEKTHTCTLLDLPGYGRSRPTSPTRRRSLDTHLTLAFYVRFLNELIDTQLTPKDPSPARPSLIGNCLGSTIALSTALEHPKKIDRLILFHLLTPQTVSYGIFGPIFKATEHHNTLRNALVQLFSPLKLSPRITKQLVKLLWGNRSNPCSQLSLTLATELSRPGLLESMGKILTDINAYHSLDQVKLGRAFPKTLLLWGTKNRILPLGGGLTVAHTLKPQGFHRIQGGGHLAPYELHEPVNALMADFLSKT